MNDSDRSRSLTMTNGMRKSFGPGGCQATTDSHRKCGETKTLQIIEEFRKLYENKMKQIDAEAGGDCVQAKINLQQDWIRDLTEQNEMLVRAVEELEVEAADRVNMLEEKLKSSSKCACELQKALKEKDKRLKELEERLKSEEGLESKKELQDLKKSMLDMRDALTAEVAHKHDTIVSLRHDVHLLEEQCRKADQQTHFKDDIIKELRKEIKQMKHQRSSKSKSRSPRTVKKEHSRSSPIHSSQTVPNTALDNLKDGIIIIKDTATVGDNVATQNIKEKYSDPVNQTIIYICENDKYKKERTKRHSPKDGESSPQIKYPVTSRGVENSRCHQVHSSDATRNIERIPSKFCQSNFESEVFLDPSYRTSFENALLVQSRESAGLSKSYEENRSCENRNHEVSRSLESTRYYMDCPRDYSGNTEEIESSFCVKNCDSMSTCQDIKATCAQYSKDIINMLSRNAVPERPDKGKNDSEFCVAATPDEFTKCLDDLPVHCSEKNLIESKEESMVLPDCCACEKLVRDNDDTIGSTVHMHKRDDRCGAFGSKIDVVMEKIGNQCLDLAQKEKTCGSKSNCAKNLYKYHHLDRKRCCNTKRNDIIVNHCCIAHIKDLKELKNFEGGKLENHCCVVKDNKAQELCTGERCRDVMEPNCSCKTCEDFCHEALHNDVDKKICRCNLSNINMYPNIEESFLKTCNCNKIIDPQKNVTNKSNLHCIILNEKNNEVCTNRERSGEKKVSHCENCCNNHDKFLTTLITSKPAINQINDSDKRPTIDENCVNEKNICVGDCVWSKMKEHFSDVRKLKQEDSCPIPTPCSDVDLKWYKLMQAFCSDNDLRNAKFYCPVIYKDFMTVPEKSNDVKPSLTNPHKPEGLKLIDQIKEFVPNVQYQCEMQSDDYKSTMDNVVEKICSDDRKSNNLKKLPKDNDDGFKTNATVGDFEWPKLRKQETSKEENLSVDSLDVQNPDCTKFFTGNLSNADFNDLAKMENIVSAAKNVAEETFTPETLVADRDVLMSTFENRQIQTDKNFYETKSSQTCHKDVRKEMFPSTSTNGDCAYSKILDGHPQLNRQETVIEMNTDREISFNEGEISGFSTPCGAKTQNNFREHQKIARYIHNLSRSAPKCNGHEDRPHNPKGKGHTHRNCGDACLPPGGAVLSPRSSWRSHRIRHPLSHEPKVLSHRTLLRGAKKQIDAPISSRSQSYPSCSKNPAYDYVPGCHYVDMHFLMNNQNVRNYFGADGKKYVNVLELSEADRKVLMQTSESLKHKQLMYEFSRMNNTY